MKLIYNIPLYSSEKFDLYKYLRVISLFSTGLLNNIDKANRDNFFESIDIINASVNISDYLGNDTLVSCIKDIINNVDNPFKNLFYILTNKLLNAKTLNEMMETTAMSGTIKHESEFIYATKVYIYNSIKSEDAEKISKIIDDARNGIQYDIDNSELYVYMLNYIFSKLDYDNQTIKTIINLIEKNEIHDGIATLFQLNSIKLHKKLEKLEKSEIDYLKNDDAIKKIMKR